VGAGGMGGWGKSSGQWLVDTDPLSAISGKRAVVSDPWNDGRWWMAESRSVGCRGSLFDGFPDGSHLQQLFHDIAACCPI